MATSDSASYELRFNTVLQVLEYSVNGHWKAVPVVAPAAGSITAAMISSGAATIGQLLTADGAGAATFEDPA